MPELTPDTTTRREFFDANREILTWLRTHRHTSNYLRSLAEAYEDTGILTPRQVSEEPLPNQEVAPLSVTTAEAVAKNRTPDGDYIISP